MNDDLQAQIKRFGLTDKETETYLAILKHGPATASEIAEKADVSKRHVYNTAEKLEDRHFVVINDHVIPTTIEPAPPDEVYERIQEEADSIYDNLEAEYQRGSGDIDDIKVLKSRQTIIDKIQRLISSAESRIAISIPVSFVPTLRAELREAVDRGVLVLVLLFKNRRNTSVPADVSFEGLGHVIRYREVDIPILLAIDRTSALVSPRGGITQPNSMVNGILLGKPYLEPIVFSSLMNTEWVIGEQLYVAPPAELPNTYTNIRHAVVDASIHAQNGTELDAEITARPKNNAEEEVTLTGEIEHIRQGIVRPTSEGLPGQCRLDLRTDEGEIVTVGGKDAYLEDYRAYLTTLERRD